MPAMRTPFSSSICSTVGMRSFGQMPSREIAEIDHQHDVVDAAHALGDARYLADGGELGLQADVDGAHHLLDARHRRAAQQHDRRIDAAVAQPADVFEARFGDAGNAAAQHGARHLRHAASALGDAEDLDAGQGAAVDDGARIALDAAKVDGDLRSGHDFLVPCRPALAGRSPACGRRPHRQGIFRNRRPWSSRHGRGRCRGRDCCSAPGR